SGCPPTKSRTDRAGGPPVVPRRLPGTPPPGRRGPWCARPARYGNRGRRSPRRVRQHGKGSARRPTRGSPPVAHSPGPPAPRAGWEAERRAARDGWLRSLGPRPRSSSLLSPSTWDSSASSSCGRNRPRVRPGAVLTGSAGLDDDLVGVELGDGVRVVSQSGKHLIGVLAQQRRARDLGLEGGELDRAADGQERPTAL